MKKIALIIAMIVLSITLFGCSSSSRNYSSSGSSYKGGYGAPKSGESLSDYIQREDPDLWNSMEERWNGLDN